MLSRNFHQGDTSEFLGGSFLVESKADLEKAAATIPGASAVRENDGPAGGFIVTFKDPDNIPCNLVWGLAAKPPKAEDVPTMNFPVEKPRKGEFRRLASIVHSAICVLVLIPLPIYVQIRAEALARLQAGTLRSVGIRQSISPLVSI